MSNLSVPKFDGGLNLTNPDTIGDNQFEVLTNMFYSASQRIQTRRGIRNFGQPVPQSVTLIDACNATTGWSASNDANTLATGTAIRGTFSLQFNITAASGSATITKSTISADITSAKGYLSFWMYVPAAFNTNLTAVKLRLGSDSTNYYEWTLPTLTEASNNFLTLLFSDATTTGTPVDATIAYARLQITYTGAYTNKTGIKFDSIYCYSALSTKPITSYYFDQRDDTGLRRAICWCGTNAFLYHEGDNVIDGYWEVIDTGLTEYEVATGRTTERTRWSADTYKNVIYMGNGVDYYRSWNDVTITTYATQPLVRYIKYLDDGDRIAAAGEDLNPSTLYYTATAPADASTINAKASVIGGDQFGKINGIAALGQVFLIGKDFKKYSVDVLNGNALPLDPDSGWYSQRSLQIVGRGMLHQTERGIESVEARNALSGASAMESEALTDDLRPLIERIDPKFRNSSCALYIKPYTNYYFTFDTTADGTPETTLVRGSTVHSPHGGWSQYSYPAIFDYGIYIDEDFVRHYLAARATSGQMLEIEYGFSDIGSAYLCELKTKAWDFDQPRIWKDFEGVSIFGLKSLGRDIEVEILVDGDVVYSATITDDNITNPNTVADSVGVYPVGYNALAGASSSTDTMPLYQYQVLLGGTQFCSGTRIQVRMFSETTSNVWTLDQMQLVYSNNVIDLFTTASLI